MEPKKAAGVAYFNTCNFIWKPNPPLSCYEYTIDKRSADEAFRQMQL
jgi:hypothetical protein